MSLNLIYSVGLFVVLHVFVWLATNLQFINKAWQDRSLMITLALALPISMCGYWAARFGYTALQDSAWGVRFIGFGTSYLIFPFMTWWLLNESMLTTKTMICIALSLVIMWVQIFWK